MQSAAQWLRYVPNIATDHSFGIVRVWVCPPLAEPAGGLRVLLFVSRAGACFEHQETISDRPADEAGLRMLLADLERAMQRAADAVDDRRATRIEYAASDLARHVERSWQEVRS